jgi:hypothetical protein
MLGLAKSQQSVKTSFGKVVCELKAAELDSPSSVPKRGLYRQGIQAVSKLPVLHLDDAHVRLRHNGRQAWTLRLKNNHNKPVCGRSRPEH